MYEYPQTRLWKKLGIKEETSLLLINSPENFIEELGELPEGVIIETDKIDSYNVAILFVESLVQLHSQSTSLTALIKPKDRLWVAWYKLSANIETDVQFEKEPAYTRRSINLDNNGGYSSDSNASRFSVDKDANGDVKLRGGNSFLHDNVD